MCVWCVCCVFQDHLRRRSDLCVWRLHEARVSGRVHCLHHGHLQTTRHQNPAQIPAAVQRRGPQGHAGTGYFTTLHHSSMTLTGLYFPAPVNYFYICNHLPCKDTFHHTIFTPICCQKHLPPLILNFLCKLIFHHIIVYYSISFVPDSHLEALKVHLHI